MKKTESRKTKAVTLLLVFFLISITSILQKSPTYDEVQHLSSGYLSLKTGNFSIGLGHPVLFRLFVALPLLFVNPDFPKHHKLTEVTWSSNPKKWGMGLDYSFAREFFYRSGNDPNQLFVLGRIMSIIIGLILGVLIYYFSKEVYGSQAALFSLLFYVFSPTMIANARLTVNDIAGALAILFSVYRFYRYRNYAGSRNLMWLIISVSAALLTKFNAVIILPVIVVWIFFIHKKKGFIKNLIFLAGVIFVINLVYGFKGTFALKDIDYEVFKEMIPMNILDRLSYYIYRIMPLPDFYLKSFIRLLEHSGRGHSTFLLGNYGRTGWWYFFPVLFLVKTPVITIILMSALIYSFFKTKKIAKGEVVLLIFIGFYGIFALRSKINIGIRHIIPMYTMLFILFGRIYSEYKDHMKGHLIKYFIPVIYIFSTQVYYPHYLSFFNIFVRPGNGYKWFVDSNIDWGQDLYALDDFYKEHDKPSILLSYFGTADPLFYGFNSQDLMSVGTSIKTNGYISPYDTEKEFFAISVTNLQGNYYRNHNIFKWVKNRKPYKKLGYSIYVYDISKDYTAAGIIGDIYLKFRYFKYAKRQYERVIYLAGTKNNKVVSTARKRLRFIESVKDEK